MLWYLMLAYHSYFSPMHLKILGIIRSMQPALRRAPCSATRCCAHERYDTGAAVRAVIRKYCFWCFVNSESSRTRLSCRDSETVVIERLPSDNLRLSSSLLMELMHHRLQKQGWGHPICPPAWYEVWGCVVDSDMMELGKCSLVGGYQLSKTLNERSKHKCF